MGRPLRACHTCTAWVCTKHRFRCVQCQGIFCARHILTTDHPWWPCKQVHDPSGLGSINRSDDPARPSLSSHNVPHVTDADSYIEEGPAVHIPERATRSRSPNRAFRPATMGAGGRHFTSSIHLVPKASPCMNSVRPPGPRPPLPGHGPQPSTFTTNHRPQPHAQYHEKPKVRPTRKMRCASPPESPGLEQATQSLSRSSPPGPVPLLPPPQQSSPWTMAEILAQNGLSLTILDKLWECPSCRSSTLQLRNSPWSSPQLGRHAQCSMCYRPWGVIVPNLCTRYQCTHEQIVYAWCTTCEFNLSREVSLCSDCLLFGLFGMMLPNGQPVVRGWPRLIASQPRWLLCQLGIGYDQGPFHGSEL